MTSTFGTELGTVFRREGPAVTAALVRLSGGDFDSAEDALQDAFTIAATRWPTEGLPPNPGGWIMTTAKRRLIDRRRRTATGAEKERLAVDPGKPVPPDDRLTLIFTCCHPALSLENRVALTLRTICGLSTAEIAAAFVVSPDTMAKRLVRAKHKIKVARIAYEVPDPDQWEPRLASVLATIYLAFNRGYDLGPVDGRGVELSEQAVDLGRLLDLLVPKEPEIEGLLALMLFTEARASARFDARGRPVLLRDQDRSLWARDLVAEAHRLVTLAIGHGSVGQYWIQAAIAGEHTMATAHAETDWQAILTLYDKLLEQTAGSPVVQLNRALALAEVAGPVAALGSLAGLDDDLHSYALLPAARAELLRRVERTAEAETAYERAISLMAPGPQQDALRRALEEMRGQAPQPGRLSDSGSSSRCGA